MEQRASNRMDPGRSSPPAASIAHPCRRRAAAFGRVTAIGERSLTIHAPSVTDAPSRSSGLEIGIANRLLTRGLSQRIDGLLHGSGEPLAGKVSISRNPAPRKV